MSLQTPLEGPVRIEDRLTGVRDGRLNVRRIQPARLQPGAPIVLLHHALGSIPQWGRFPVALAERCRREVIVYERRGHGASSPLPCPRTPDYLHREALDELPALLDALQVERPILLGHSDGGSIALLYAAFHHPTAISTLAAHVVVEAITLEGIRAACTQPESLLERLRRYHGDQTEALLAAWADTWLAPEFRSWDITGLLPNILCPALFIQGIDDEYGTVEQIRRLERHVSGPCRTLLLENCGHEPYREQPERVLLAVEEFVGDW